MIDELDVDMEEIESRLYSQVYYTTTTQDQNVPQEPIQLPSNNNIKKHPRYFSVTINKPVPDKLPEFTPMNSSNGDREPQKDSEINLNNNTGVLPSQVEFQQNIKSRNYEKFIERKEKRELKRLKNVERNKRRREKRNQQKRLFLEHKAVAIPISVNTIEKGIITLSDDSEGSDCVEIPQNKTIVCLSSDDEKLYLKKEIDLESVVRLEQISEEPLTTVSNENKLKIDDDLIFVEPEPKQIEIIEIDCDENSEKHSETTSTTNSDHLKVPDVPKRKKTIFRDLRTPDSSASNDFLDCSVDSNQFNFGLHGLDFGNTSATTASKVVNAFETDSTTSEVTNCFNVVDFETPTKRFFEDANLESFGNYITPNRKGSEKYKNDGHFEKIPTKANLRVRDVPIEDTSGSSSESDYEEDKVKYLNSKRLPKLSEVHTDDENAVLSSDDVFMEESNDKNKSKSDAGDVNIESKISENKDMNIKSESDILNKSTKIVESIRTNKRKSEPEGLNVSNKRLKVVEKDVVESRQDMNDSMNITNNSNFIIIDEVDNTDIIDSSDESYFSCDDENIDDLSKNLTLSNCQKKVVNVSEKSDDSKKHMMGSIDFNLADIYSTMSDDPKLWKILDVDRLHFKFATPRGQRCRRCRQYGHISNDCTNKNDPPACILCAKRNHIVKRCPMAMCTSCGRLGQYKYGCRSCVRWKKHRCNVCKMMGHSDVMCPDTWRRYHLTTEPGPIIKPTSTREKPSHDRWCSGCGRPGHYEEMCRGYQRTYRPVRSEVVNYVDVYNFPEKPQAIDNNNGGGIVSEENFQNAPTETYNHDYFRIDYFPPIGGIPKYFQHLRAYLKEKFMKSNQITFAETHGNNSEILSAQKPISSDNLIKLTNTEFAYIHSKFGVEFINSIRMKDGIRLVIEKYEDRPAGELRIFADSEERASSVKENIFKFLRRIPVLVNFPQDSKLMLDFLLKHKKILAQANGNCCGLFKRLCQISKHQQGRRVKKTFNKEKFDIGTTIHLLLFGRLKLDRGKEHVDTINEWINKLSSRPNYQIPFNYLYDIHRSYDYLFKLKKSPFSYKRLCYQHNYYISPEQDDNYMQQQIHV